jgi:molybdenum cofactor cytidylyltransferase
VQDMYTREKTGASQPPVAGIVLAAGLSRRMGRPKALLELGGKPLARRAVETALNGGLSPVVLVGGEHTSALRKAVADLDGVEVVENPRFAEGMASSLTTGLTRVHGQASAAMILLADQPLLPAKVVRSLVEKYWEDSPCGVRIVRPSYAGTPGHPVLFDAQLFPELAVLTGDIGAREVIQRHRDALAWLDFDEGRWGIDVDTPEAFAAVQRWFDQVADDNPESGV